MRQRDPIWERYAAHLIRTGQKRPAAEGAELDFRAKAWLPSSRDARVVDLGCGFGSRLLALYRLGYRHLIGVDRCAQVLQIARDCLPPQIELHCADAREWLAVTRASFDRILLFHVLEHMPVEAAAALLEVARHHLLPAGAVVIEVPNMSSVMAGNTFWSDITHVRGYTEYSLGQLLDLAGYPHWETVCRPPRPFARGLVTGRRSGTSLGWWLNRLLHLGLYRVCVSGPMPRCFCPALLMLAYAG